MMYNHLNDENTVWSYMSTHISTQMLLLFHILLYMAYKLFKLNLMSVYQKYRHTYFIAFNINKFNS